MHKDIKIKLNVIKQTLSAKHIQATNITENWISPITIAIITHLSRRLTMSFS
jgi:hypothetical protein